jgi:hypothetical protein
MTVKLPSRLARYPAYTVTFGTAMMITCPGETPVTIPGSRCGVQSGGQVETVATAGFDDDHSTEERSLVRELPSEKSTLTSNRTEPPTATEVGPVTTATTSRLDSEGPSQEHAGAKHRASTEKENRLE